MKTYIFEGKTYNSLPDPLYTADGSAHSPMTEDRFRALGGTITDDGKATPQEKLLASLTSYIAELKKEADELALNITVEEFMQAAADSKVSTDLIDWARKKGVPDAMIAEARNHILMFLADAARPEIGMNWNDIFPKQPSN